MSRAVVFRLISRKEFDEAVGWYEGKKAGLGLAFKDTIHEIIERIATQPLAFRAVRGRVRRAIVSRFPYTVHFPEENKVIVVLAIFHAARDPRQLPRRA